MEEQKKSTTRTSYITNKVYILYLKDITNIRALPYHFPSVSLAQHSLLGSVPKKDRALFKVVSGRYIKKYLPKLYHKIKVKLYKYKYPGDLKTYQEKKSFRTITRRNLRRMDLLTLNNRPTKITKRDKLKGIKHVKNKQAIATQQNTFVRVIQLDKFNKNTYLMVTKILSPKRGKDLCRLKCYRVDFKKGTVFKTKVRVQNKDLLTPFTLSRFRKIEENYSFKIPEKIWQKLTTTKLIKLKRK